MKKILLLVAIIILVVSGQFIFVPPSEDATEKIFIIEKGEGVNEISHHLKEQNFIKNKFVFETYVWLKKIQSDFKAGEHKLRQNMRIWEVAKSLTSISEINERNIKILEGWNNQEISSYLDSEGIVNKEIFLEVARDYEPETEKYEWLKDGPRNATLEGYLFPDTYRIYKDLPAEFLGEKNKETAMAEHIIKKMLGNFDQKLTPELRAEIIRQKKTIFEILTMASIVEKEARGNDMAKVADIFWRRIDEGIALQSDATVNYATGKYETQPSLDDLEINSPYNTYKYRGLPAGPIGNPGLGAIWAAVYPEANDYWFFLHAKDGETIYSKNFEEHKINKAKYLR